MYSQLFLRSTAILVSLWALIFGLISGIGYAIADASGDVVVAGLALSPLLFAVIIASIYILIQYLIGPFIMDLQLRWFYRMTWIDPSQLPPEMFDAVNAAIQKHNIGIAKIGMIHDQSPNAFTYGHTRKNARIVVTEGLINLLTPEERVAVLYHEIGHIANNDFIFMTIAQLVPLFLYQIYIWSDAFADTMIKMQKKGRKRAKGKSSNAENAVYLIYAIVIISYILWRISTYIVLFLSRLREYYADYFSAQEMGNPNAMSSALVRVAYGIVSNQAQLDNRMKDASGRERRDLRRSQSLNTGMRAMGVMDINTAKGLVMQAYSHSGFGQQQQTIDSRTISAITVWDLVSPWAKFIELSSTHPLTGKRLRNLKEQSIELGQQPIYPEIGTIKPPESLWDEFASDLFYAKAMWLMFFVLPGLGVLVALLAGISLYLGAGIGLMLFGVLWFRRVKIKYPEIDEFDNLQRQPNTVVEALSSMEKDGYYEASPVRGKPIVIEGTVLGRGQAGYYFSEDFVLQDKTGLVRVDYNSLIPFGNIFFALRRVEQMMGQTVRLVGWYHRTTMPYVTVYKIYAPGKTHHNRWRGANRILAWFFVILGLIVAGFDIILPLLG